MQIVRVIRNFPVCDRESKLIRGPLNSNLICFFFLLFLSSSPPSSFSPLSCAKIAVRGSRSRTARSRRRPRCWLRWWRPAAGTRRARPASQTSSASSATPSSASRPPKSFPLRLYRVTHLLVNLGWVDFNFGCYTLCLVLPGPMRNWQNWLSCWARGGTSQIKINPTQVRQEMCHHVV